MSNMLGAKVRDNVSGFAGVVYAVTTFLNGCIRCGVQPPVDEKGNYRDDRWFDVEQLEVIEERAVIVPGQQTGGERSDPPPRPTGRGR